MIEFDFSRFFKPNVEKGLERSEVEEIAGKIREILKEYEEEKPGFVRIVGDQRLLGSVKELEEWLVNFDDFVVLGIGGSALGNIALHNALRPLNWNFMSREERNGYLRVFVVDNVDPDFVSSILSIVNLKKSVFNVISKSGSTAEAMANYLVVRNVLESLGLDPREHFVFTTDPEKGALRKIAKEEGIRSLEVPPDVGGRFSVLSPVGMLSALAEGIDIDRIHDGASDALKACFETDIWKNPAAMIAATHYLFMERGRNVVVMMPYSNRLYYLADWFRQLWAESLGKDGKGQTPVKALGTTDQHSQIQLYNEGPDDKIITFIKVKEYGTDVRMGKIHEDDPTFSYLGGKYLSELINAELEGTESALLKNGKPSMKLIFDSIDEYNVGYFLLVYEMATAIVGKLMGVNPFDQPGVELGKKITYALMGREGYEEYSKISRIKEELRI